LACAYNSAWKWLRNDFNKDTHLLSIFAFGRGDYGYITKEREWQQTTTFLAKIMAAHKMFTQAMASEGIKQFAMSPSLATFHGLNSSRMAATGNLVSGWFVAAKYTLPCRS